MCCELDAVDPVPNVLTAYSGIVQLLYHSGVRSLIEKVPTVDNQVQVRKSVVAP